MVAAGADARPWLRRPARAIPLTRVEFAVRVTTRAGVNTVDGADADGVLHIRVRAAPADGAANDAALRLLAHAVHVAPSRVVLVRGATSRTKSFAVDVEPSVLAGLWPGLLTREE